MKKLHNSNWVDERLLFHGTNPSHVPAICEQNFDWRICGTHGTTYGKGSYFARDASYSHDYCSSRISRYSMFVAQVLVGKFVQGNSEYLRPPPTPNNRNLYNLSRWHHWPSKKPSSLCQLCFLCFLPVHILEKKWWPKPQNHRTQGHSSDTWHVKYNVKYVKYITISSLVPCFQAQDVSSSEMSLDFQDHQG